ncbi:hypothetical protein [Pyrobaculum aerophilum]|uniref:hypothetical protein n=1 Tax=Pyrobaculum aerophilum TaxID=13773 RepID=UPI0023F21482|nr:hypothetical protein [Pyrobaculum aerophilum]MCX8136640.1 hypothetical protein [Pyrobaculum aerophilum]
MAFHDRVILKIDNSLLELAKREGRKIRIYDVAIVEVDKDVDPFSTRWSRRSEMWLW